MPDTAHHPLLDRLAETEYAAVSHPSVTTDLPFGRWVHTPEWPNRHDGNQLIDVRWNGAVEDLLAELERLYSPTGYRYRKMTAHDPATCERLFAALPDHGWKVSRMILLIRGGEPQRSINPDVRIEVVEGSRGSHEGLRFLFDDVREDEYGPDAPVSVTGDGMRFADWLDARHDRHGEQLCGWLEGRPAGMTGFFLHEGIARYRLVATARWARNRGVASTLIRYVRDHPLVVQQDALGLFVDAEGPRRLYESLGFSAVGEMIEAVRLPDDIRPE